MQFFLIMMCSFFFLSCEKSSEKDYEKANKDKIKTVDISTLGLEEGLRTKYSLLQWHCGIEIKVSRPSSEVEDNRIDTNFRMKKGKRKILVWNLLTEFDLQKIVTINYEFKGVSVDLAWSLEPKLVKDLKHKVYDNKGYYFYHLKNAVVLEGAEEVEVIEYDESEKVVAKMSSSDPKVSFIDRVPTSIFKRSFGPEGNSSWLTSVDASCLLQAIPKDGYKSEFSVVRPKL
jgi:hypothetical protein